MVNPNKISVMGVIPARYASTRFPGKPLVDIFGKPMIYWVATRVARCKQIDSYIVATDDKRIVDVCQQYQIPVMMTGDNHVNGTERVAEVASKTNADIYVNIQGDEPILEPESVDRMAAAMLMDESIEYAQAGIPIVETSDLDNPTVVKLAIGMKGDVVYLSRSPIPFPRNRNKYVPVKCLGLYGFRKSFLFKFVQMGESPLESIEGVEQLRVIENGGRIHYVEMQTDSISIDTPEDLQRILADHRSAFIEPVQL